MKTTHIAAALCLAAAAAACSGRDAVHTLSDAETSIALGDTALARKYVGELADTSATALTPSMLCRQAIVYARLSEMADNPDDMGAAVECYERALQMSVDSVNEFVSTLDVGELAYVSVILSVAKALHEPESRISDYEMEMDSDWIGSEPANVELSTSEP